MTECTGKRYWRARILDAKKRYVIAAYRRGPRVDHSTAADEKRYHAWVRARVDYFNDELGALMGTKRQAKVSYINDLAKDWRARGLKVG